MVIEFVFESDPAGSVIFRVAAGPDENANRRDAEDDPAGGHGGGTEGATDAAGNRREESAGSRRLTQPVGEARYSFGRASQRNRTKANDRVRVILAATPTDCSCPFSDMRERPLIWCTTLDRTFSIRMRPLAAQLLRQLFRRMRDDGPQLPDAFIRKAR